MSNTYLICLIFPFLSVAGIIPLLGWALSGDKAHIHAANAVSFGVLIAIFCAFGRPQPILGGLPNSLSFALIPIALCGAVISLWVQYPRLRLSVTLCAFMISSWIMVGGPSLTQLKTNSLSLILIGATVMALTLRKSMYREVPQHPYAVYLLHLISFAVLAYLAFMAQQISFMKYGMGLAGVSLGVLFWCLPKLNFKPSLNAHIALVFAQASLIGLLYQAGAVNLLTVLVWSAIPLSQTTAFSFIYKSPKIGMRLHPFFYFFTGTIAAALTLIFAQINQHLS